MIGKSSAFTTCKEIQVFGSDRFSKYLKYLRNFEKWSKLTQNSDFFERGKHATLSHHFEPS